MQNFTQNLYFHAIILLILSSGVWYIFTDLAKIDKQKVLDVFTDFVLYFILTAFAINILLNFREVIDTPYRILILSSREVGIATFLVIGYAAYTYGEKLWQQVDKAKSAIQLLLFIGLMNHLYLYFVYKGLQSILFSGFFIVLLGLLSRSINVIKINPLLLFIIATIIHLLLMGSSPVLYFNFAFYPIPLLIILSTLGMILFIQRRKQLSKQK